VAEEENRIPSKQEALEKILDAGLKLLSAEDLKPHTPCPDSWTFALYMQGQVDEETRRKINSHIAFCSDCYREYVALADPDDVMKQVEQELHSATAAPPERLPEAWRRLLEQLKGFVIDLGKAYGAGVLVGSIRILDESPAFALRGEGEEVFKTVEVPVGENRYNVRVAIAPQGLMHCDVENAGPPPERPLMVSVHSETGEVLYATETGADGKANFRLSESEVPRDLCVFIFTLGDRQNNLVFQMPEMVAHD